MRIVKQFAMLEAVTADITGRDPAFAIERAARTCYRSEGQIALGSAAKLIAKLRGMHHDAMLEFSDATFRIICDRGVSHEIVRHRLASYAQESTRYCNYALDKFNHEITVIEPPGLSPSARASWKFTCEQAERAYFAMLDDGCKPQIARSVLPTCLKTELCMKANFREWGHFIALRTSPAAHPQMREVAEMIRTLLLELCPEVFAPMPQ